MKKAKNSPAGGKKIEKEKPHKVQQFQVVKGMADILPKDQNWWKMINRVGDSVAELHDYYFIETPILENAGLFEASLGMSTDVIEKEMYVFKTKGGDRVALRPEGTTAVVRSYLENHLGYFAAPLRVYYTGPMFRYERPQAGRYRQLHQLGFEIIGDSDPVYDVQIILAVFAFLKEMRLKNFKIRVNSIGCKVCRPNYKQKIKEYYYNKKSELCKDCENRYEKNPLRLLDCKEEGCRVLLQKAPVILDCLCQACNNHFRTVLELLEDNAIVYEPDPFLVRGLDYYSKTVFEVYYDNPANALAGGGRFDYLSEFLGGRMLPSVGAAIGLDRVIETLKSLGIEPNLKLKPKVFFAAVGENAKKASVKLIDQLRENNVAVVEALGKKSLRGQMKIADKYNLQTVLIFGQKELFEEMIIIRDMKTGAQESIVLGRMIEEVKRRLR